MERAASIRRVVARDEGDRVRTVRARLRAGEELREVATRELDGLEFEEPKRIRVRPRERKHRPDPYCRVVRQILRLGDRLAVLRRQRDARPSAPAHSWRA